MPAEVPADRSVRVRRVVADDWPQLRALRLEALADTPIAYCESLDDAVRASDDSWRARAVRGAVGGDSVQVMAWTSDQPVGTSVGFLDGGDAVLAAVYVAPSQRGTGLLGRLVEQVVAWAREQDASRLRLLVHESNGRARGAYERLGFVATGHREPYPLDPSTQEVELALDLR